MEGLTDQLIAEALGWKRYPQGWGYGPKAPKWMDPPNFMRDLEAIVAEVERHGCDIELIKSGGYWFGWVGSAKTKCKTAPGALCKALYYFLRDK